MYRRQRKPVVGAFANEFRRKSCENLKFNREKRATGV